MTLTEFLLARLDEDEETAQECVDDSPHWIASSDGIDQIESSGGFETVTGYFNQARRPQANQHIARHDPARVLAEVAAKRRIVILAKTVESSGVEGFTVLTREVLRDLASVYADHPDYNPQWNTATLKGTS